MKKIQKVTVEKFKKGFVMIINRLIGEYLKYWMMKFTVSEIVDSSDVSDCCKGERFESEEKQECSLPEQIY